MNYKDKIINSITKLQEEAKNLVDERMSLEQRHHGIDIRLTQVTGAIDELEQLLNEEQLDETENTSKS